MIFSFGHAEKERIEVDVQSYEREATGEYYDDNWLTVEIRIQAGGFHGKMSASFITNELITFLSALRPLYQSLNGTARFDTLEEQLSLKLTGDGRGHFELSGEVSDQPGIGNSLRFTLQFDQSQLGTSIRELEQVTLRFPERKARH
ncbi:MAG TPA: hypothetical protein DCQ83_05935 [Fibrobacteres bacterium]|jgi:hypothetical protein|nr:hypothetical protein [Fibrobacterota bacterium]